MKKNDKEESRRAFLIKLTLGISGLSALAVIFPALSAVLAPLLKKPAQVWRKVSMLGEMPVGGTQLVRFENAVDKAWSGLTTHSAAWLRRESDDKFIAFSANCTHLGCPVRWEEGAQLFMCPCHGGVYYKDGTVAAGPPPKPLVQYEVRINKEAIEILTAPVPLTSINS